LCAKDIDIADASKEPDPEDVRKAGCDGDENKLVKFQVAVDALGVYVNKKNIFFQNQDVSMSLANGDLAYLFNNANDWNQMVDRLGLQTYSAKMAATPEIKKYLPGRESATLKFMVEQMFKSDLPEDQAGRAAKVKQLMEQLLSKAAIANENDYLLADMIGAEPNGVGFLGYAYYKYDQDRIAPILIDEKRPTQEFIDNDKYPLMRKLYIYTTNNRIRHGSSGICRFIKYYLASVNYFVDSVGYFAMPPDDGEKSKETWSEYCVKPSYRVSSQGRMFMGN
jgi:phosphate transport system substrate-binding protein